MITPVNMELVKADFIGQLFALQNTLRGFTPSISREGLRINSERAGNDARVSFGTSHVGY